ncbi:MAG: ribosome hibernation-promoting factor, HPF/YfiA family [Anaerolineae bacterium]|jgi:putative sigma-54 modulation protein
MDLELQVRHFDLTDTVRDYVERKVGRLDRYLPDIKVTRVELEHGQRRSQGEVYTAQITTWVDSHILRAEEMNPDLFAAIDLASDKVHRQVERYKGKRLRRWHEPVKLEPDVAEPPEEGEARAGIVRRKRFPVHPMTEDEAVDQLELLGHDFFLFHNADSGIINVLYRRKDGQLGLIQPEPA